MIGTGSGNSIIGPEMDEWRIAIVERGTFGGTCLNRGCIPSKMLIYAADVAEHAKHGRDVGSRPSSSGRLAGNRDRVFTRIDPIAESGRQYRLGLPHIDRVRRRRPLRRRAELEVDGTTIRGEQIVIAAGARPFIPELSRDRRGAVSDQRRHHAHRRIARA